MMFPDGLSGFLKKEAKTNPGVASALTETGAASISAARDISRFRKDQDEENKKQGDHRVHVVGKLKKVEDGQEKIIQQGQDLARTAKANKKMMTRALDPKGTSEEIDRLKKQVLEGKERENRYRAERDEAKAENVKLKKSDGDKDRKIAALEKSNEDKDRKIAALERQLAAASTS